MNKLFMAAAVSLVLLLGSRQADAGRMYLEWIDCSPTFKLWEVSWNGPWDILGGKHLDQGPSNDGPWDRVLSFVPDNSCYFPARNLRWYRIASPKFPIGFRTLASIWVPQSRCARGWIR